MSREVETDKARNTGALFQGDPIRITANGDLECDPDVSGVVAAISLDGICYWWKRLFKGVVVDES